MHADRNMDNIHIFSDFRLRVGETRESKTRKFAATQWQALSNENKSREL